MDTITNDKVGSSSSKMKNMGQYYIENQNTYGTNALLMYGVSGNESAGEQVQSPEIKIIYLDMVQ